MATQNLLNEETARQTPGLHRIGSVSRLANVPVSTLRIWESRYGAFAPDKTEGRHRLYDEADVLRASLLRLEKNSLDQCHRQSRAFLETLEALDTALEAGLTRLAGLARRLREEGAALPRAENAPAAD